MAKKKKKASKKKASKKKASKKRASESEAGAAGDVFLSDGPTSEEERLAELQATAAAVEKLAGNEDAFRRTVKAFRAEDAEEFQAQLAQIGLLQLCRLICRWICSKHCVFICHKLCGPIDVVQELDVDEMLEFAHVTARIAEDEKLLKRFVAAVDLEDERAFRALIDELELQRYCHQLCHWLCAVRCRLVCRIMCPPPPLITKVSHIPTSQINAQGYGAGPSSGSAATPPDNFAAGLGHHVFGGSANIRGVFNVAGAYQYKVEHASAPGGPWTPILETIHDYRWVGYIEYYDRLPNAGGWYNINDVLIGPDAGPGMGLAGLDYLTDWPTPNVPNALRYLKLTVRNSALAEFESPVVPVRVDNEAPTQPVISLQLQAPDGTLTNLGCCEEISEDDGLLVITIQASDPNFGRLTVVLQGGCGVSLAIVDTGGTPLSKTYNGDVTDTGYPVATSFVWDPWAAGVDPCCYLIYVRIWDRAIVDDADKFSGAHHNANWHSITIA